MLTFVFWIVVALYLSVVLHWWLDTRRERVEHQRKAIEMETIDEAHN